MQGNFISEGLAWQLQDAGHRKNMLVHFLRQPRSVLAILSGPAWRPPAAEPDQGEPTDGSEGDEESEPSGRSERDEESELSDFSRRSCGSERDAESGRSDGSWRSDESEREGGSACDGPPAVRRASADGCRGGSAHGGKRFTPSGEGGEPTG